MRILIADDDAALQKVLQLLLASAGHEVLPAGDGAAALEILGREKVDAIISDILMPRMDGYRFCLEVRCRPEWDATPFIIHTSTYTSSSDEKAALKMGADRFLRKPVPAGELMAALNAAVAEAPHRPARPGRSGQELDLMQEYNARLVAKLEQANIELEVQAGSLRNSQEEFRALAARLQDALEQERIRIARELHDGLGEFLTGIGLGLGWVQTELERPNQELQRAKLIERLVSLGSLTRGTADLVRKLCTELRPSILDDLGLAATIEWQTNEFARQAGIRCETTFESEEIRVSVDKATGIFRIFQELLTNVARHSGASKVRVMLKRTGPQLMLRVQDNGKGIRPEQAAGNKSLGLLGMRERAILLGGTVEITGQPGKGTVVTVTVPIASEPKTPGRK